MNFEKLLGLTVQYWNKISNKKALLVYIQYHYELLVWKKRKLKLGTIVFVIKEHKFDEFVLWEEPEIKFINQDTTVEDERKVETIFKKLGWEKNARSYFALSVVIAIMLFKIRKNFRQFLFDVYPAAYVRDVRFEQVIRCGFENVFDYNSIGFIYDFARLNFWLIDIFTQFCIFFNVIF